MRCWNGTDVEYPERDGTIHALFELAVDRAPDRVAVEFEGQTLTYAELNKRANQLARWLRGTGVGPDVPVGLCVERSLEMVVGLLGILKAGGAYVPLDPDYPAERLLTILESARPPLVLTQQHLRDRLSAVPVPCLELDAGWPRVLELQDATNLTPLAGPSSLAYIIYTSGSTGTPKGVMNEHRGVVNRLLWMQAEYQVCMADQVLQKTPFSFDVSVWEFFWPLLTGARLVLARPGGHREPAYLARLIEEAGITITHFVPSMLGLFLEEPGLELRCRGLKHVFTSGEALPEELASRCLTRIAGARLHNLYGPTEAAVEATYHECRASDPAGPVPIGRPIANLRTYVLDAVGKPVSPGEIGELYLGGVGVARGYWNQPALTAERFLADPFNPVAGSRMYKTGDLARWLPNGELEYLGRTDFQVKLRGFRIELGEIETALVRLADGDIRQAVVTAHEARPGETRLVAYLLGGSTLSDTAIREGLARTLPEYMVPSVFVRLAAFPLTTSGKVDRRALPAPGLGRATTKEFTAPRTRLEQTLALLWQDVLGLERVGIHDHFFRLGGQSLTAARVVARAAALGFSVPVRTLFENPTIAELAAVLASRFDADQTQDWSRTPATALALAVGRPALLPPDEDRAQPRVMLPDPTLAAGSAPLASFAQQRLWFIDQLEGPGLAAYNIGTATKLEGKLSVEALRLALVDLVQRHEPLRTSFELRAGQLVQLIHESFTLELPVEDLRDLVQAERAALNPDQPLPCVEACGRIEADRPFNLTAVPLLRARLLHTGEDEHVFLLTVHHVATDGWSMGVLWRELGQTYQSRLDGQTPEFPALPVRYTDYAAWQRQDLTAGKLATSLNYWKAQLAGLEDLELPADRARPSVLTYRGDRLDFKLTSELMRRLQSLCDDAGVTPHIALLAAFQAVLGRLASREDLAVGVPVAGRPRSELEGLIGFFVNTVVLRANLSGAPSYRELLARTRQASLDAQEHSEVPFERLVSELKPERQRNRNPLVQVVFQYHDPFKLEPLAPGVLATSLETPTVRVRFDLELYIKPLENELVGSFYYSTDLFDRSTIERFARLFERFLTAALNEPDQPLAPISLLDPGESLLLAKWNQTTADYPANSTVHRLFSQQAARTPGAVAIVDGTTSRTYAELDHESNQWAAYLRTFGAGPDTVVAVALPRSSELIMTLLAILKAGAAYLPLDPANPADRNATILTEAQASLLVTTREMQARLPEARIPVVRLDALKPEFISIDKPSDVQSEKGAYVMYTSGSTGVPKGVMIGHRSIARLVFGQTYASFGPDRVFLQLAPVAFDASTFEIWGALLHGSKLVIVPEGPLDLGVVGDLIQRHGVTTLWLTAGLFNEVIDTCPEILRGVSQILTGGEPLSTRHVRLAQRLLGSQTQLINGYGPTECTTFACCYPIPISDQDSDEPIPIGRPLANTYAYVMDAKGCQVPLGVAGELYLGGVGVACGYLNRPNLTAERFVADPFCSEPDRRMYRTGDLARWRSDGVLEYLGRLDCQVKLRGFRIELGEIEAALEQLTELGIRQSVVAVHTLHRENKLLVAYLVGAARVEDEAIRQALAKRLPTYMIPTVFMRLDSLPLSINGKVDRAALPLPVLAGDPVRESEIPRSVLEQELSRVWREVLGLDQVGIHDNFFQAGGHSLLAVRLVAAIRERFQVDLSLAKIFQYPTIALLVNEIEIQKPGEQGTLPTLECLRTGRGDFPPLVVMPGLTGDVFPAWQRLAASLPEDRAVYAFHIAGSKPYWDGCNTFKDIARGLVEQLLKTGLSKPYHLAGWSFGGFLAYEVARQLVDQGFPVGSVLIFDTGPEPIEFARQGRKRRNGRDLTSMALNLPAWLVEYADLLRDRDWQRMMSRKVSTRIRRILRLQKEVVSSVPEFLRTNEIPEIYRQRGLISYAMLQEYRPEPYLGRVTLFRCRTRWIIHRAYRKYLGWDQFVKGPLQEISFPGPHSEFLSSRHFAKQLAQIEAELRHCDKACLADRKSSSSHFASP